MLSRCYKPHTEQLEHSYAGCTVAEEWLRFSNFLAFWKENYRDGYVLDKDLLHPVTRYMVLNTAYLFPST